MNPKKKQDRTDEIRARRARVLELMRTKSWAQIAVILGVPRTLITSDRRALGLAQTRRESALGGDYGLLWSAELLELLHLMRPVMSVCELSELLGRSDSSVRVKCHKLGLSASTGIPGARQAARQAAQERQQITRDTSVRQLTAAQLAARVAEREALRIAYSAETMPAHITAFFKNGEKDLPDLSYRGQVKRSFVIN